MAKSNDLLKVHGLDKSFDGVKALVNFSCSLQKGEILGLIGPNGAGKTTLFNVITGFIRVERGQIVFKGQKLEGMRPHRIAEAGIARTFQNVRLIRQLSVLDNVLLWFKEQPGERLGKIFFQWGKSHKQEIVNRKRAISLLEEAGIVENAHVRAEALSYGQQKLLSLVCCLAAQAEVLLLDEPVAGIAPEMVERMLGTIRQVPGDGSSVIMIEHNLDAVMKVCDRVIFMDAGEKISEGDPEEVRNDPNVIKAYLE